ncbi:MAG: formate dehydrogenase accessory sulfurtransferase FdhD [Litorilituus sp.]|jgi:FdhD protein|nr:formate dehydrogenase accessory sulfurtransferase FdhD [Litorilituus sp.]
MADTPTIAQKIKRIDKVTYFREQSIKRVVEHDAVLTEQPLQINLLWYKEDLSTVSKVFAITMRSVGDDSLLILGLLFSEGVIKRVNDIVSIFADNSTESQPGNSWQVQLIEGIEPNLTSIERFQTTYSSCGLCGATSLKALELKAPANLLQFTKGLKFNIDFIYKLAKKMCVQQQLFSLTGGAHSAALFNQTAQLLTIHEDIGRHNAVDKLIGHGLREDTLPANNQLLVMLVSGRVSFEIVQKAVMAGISILVSVGAPSDLAIKAAQRFELTLIGFLKENSFNLYHGDWRIKA